MPEAPAFATFAEAADFARARFECSDSSESHVRLQVTPAGMAPDEAPASDAAPAARRIEARLAQAQPVTLYHGRSAAAKDRELVHVASPLLGIGLDRALDAAALMDSMPLGGLRLLGEHLHVHDSLPLPGADGTTLEATVRLVASEAAALRAELAQGTTNSAEPADTAVAPAEPDQRDSHGNEAAESSGRVTASPADDGASRRPADDDRTA